MASYKTLNNHVAKFIVEKCISGNPKFTFIRLYNAYKDDEFEPATFIRLYLIVKKMLLEFHELEDILFALHDCPLIVKLWFNEFKNELKGGVKL